MGDVPRKKKIQKDTFPMWRKKDWEKKKTFRDEWRLISKKKKKRFQVHRRGHDAGTKGEEEEIPRSGFCRVYPSNMVENSRNRLFSFFQLEEKK